jgi:co-chaperonin GroES (HSP10)
MSKKKGDAVTKSGIHLIKIEESFSEEAHVEEVGKGITDFKKGDSIFVKDYQVVWITDLKKEDTDFGFIEANQVLGKKS